MNLYYTFYYLPSIKRNYKLLHRLKDALHVFIIDGIIIFSMYNFITKVAHLFSYVSSRNLTTLLGCSINIIITMQI